MSRLCKRPEILGSCCVLGSALRQVLQTKEGGQYQLEHTLPWFLPQMTHHSTSVADTTKTPDLHHLAVCKCRGSGKKILKAQVATEGPATFPRRGALRAKCLGGSDNRLLCGRVHAE